MAAVVIAMQGKHDMIWHIGIFILEYSSLSTRRDSFSLSICTQVHLAHGWLRHSLWTWYFYPCVCPLFVNACQNSWPTCVKCSDTLSCRLKFPLFLPRFHAFTIPFHIDDDRLCYFGIRSATYDFLFNSCAVLLVNAFAFSMFIALE